MYFYPACLIDLRDRRTMDKMDRRALLPLFTLSALAIIQLTPVPVRSWWLSNSRLLPADLPAGSLVLHLPALAALDSTPGLETLELMNGRLSIISNHEITWQSPETWQVVQAEFTDLNQDGAFEVSILTWRPFQPWPVDEFLPHGGRIDDFHDGTGFSCHLILIGWIGSGYGELWAGSALADPLLAFSAADLNGDEKQELITLEGHYTYHGSSPARSLKVWDWNGFGFSVVSTVKNSSSALWLARTPDGAVLILTP